MLSIIKKQLTKNYSVDRTIVPKYIVIHETDNEGRGANAMAHFNYWNNNSNAQSSTHFVVDSENIVQMLELNQRAWHVGDNRGYSDITNDNSIGIEICVNSDGNYDTAWYNAVDLVRHLMDVTGLRADRIKMHNHASGKHCPSRMIDNNWWSCFMNYINDPSKATPTSTETPTLDIPRDFDFYEYLKKNDDVMKCILNGGFNSGVNGQVVENACKCHYLEYGKKEGRIYK